MLEERLTRLHSELSIFANSGWIPSVSKNESIFYALAPSKELYSTSFLNNPLNKEKHDKDESLLASIYLKKLIEYMNLVKLFPTKDYSVSFESGTSFNSSKQVNKHKDN